MLIYVLAQVPDVVVDGTLSTTGLLNGQRPHT